MIAALVPSATIVLAMTAMLPLVSGRGAIATETGAPATVQVPTAALESIATFASEQAALRMFVKVTIVVLATVILQEPAKITACAVLVLHAVNATDLAAHPTLALATNVCAQAVRARALLVRRIRRAVWVKDAVASRTVASVLAPRAHPPRASAAAATATPLDARALLVRRSAALEVPALKTRTAMAAMALGAMGAADAMLRVRAALAPAASSATARHARPRRAGVLTATVRGALALVTVTIAVLVPRAMSALAPIAPLRAHAKEMPAALALDATTALAMAPAIAVSGRLVTNAMAPARLPPALAMNAPAQAIPARVPKNLSSAVSGRAVLSAWDLIAGKMVRSALKVGSVATVPAVTRTEPAVLMAWTAAWALAVWSAREKAATSRDPATEPRVSSHSTLCWLDKVRS